VRRRLGCGSDAPTTARGTALGQGILASNLTPMSAFHTDAQPEPSAPFSRASGVTGPREHDLP